MTISLINVKVNCMNKVLTRRMDCELTIRLNKKMNQKFNKVLNNVGRTKSEIIRNLISDFIRENQQ